MSLIADLPGPYGIIVRLDAANRQLTELLHLTGLDRVLVVQTAPGAQAVSAA
ncbi:hypothetical protein ACLQ2P_15715 [Actinomadura citrea]|uniref:hypothetical protein n=1 Tax=Actinomadura TaxID=1988 RepID=UPI0033EF0929